MSESARGFVWYELMTTDADAAQRFYSDVVGWRVADSGIPNMDYRLLNGADGQVGGILQLTEEMISGGARPIWMGYIAVEDVDAAAESVSGAGGKVTLAPRDIPNVGRFAMIADPQGVPSCIFRDAGGNPGQAFKQGADGHCAWNELATSDSKAAVSFYTRQFGWTLGDTMPMGDLGDYQMFKVGEDTIGGIMAAAPNEAPPMWRFYFRVPSLEQAIDKIKSNGASIVHGPQQVPGDDEIVIGMDPQGAVFAIVAKRA